MIRLVGWAMMLSLLMLIDAPVIAAPRPMQIEDLYRFRRVADPQISPDGKWVVYQLSTISLAENKSSTNLWIASTDGKTPTRQLTTTPKSDRHPRWIAGRQTNRVRVQSRRRRNADFGSSTLTAARPVR